MPAVIQNESNRELAAYKREEDDRLLKSLGGDLNVTRYIRIWVNGTDRGRMGMKG